MFIPLRTDRPPKRRPVVTEGLIALNIVVYVAGLIGHATGAFDLEHFIEWGQFDPQHFRVWQIFTSMFMHDPYGIWHIVFNMLFLWIFGAPVEDRLGRVSYLLFYLMGGALAAIAHMMVSPAPIIGASGAIAAVTGAFLALFPRSRILIFVLIGFGTISIPSAWFILLYFAVDVLKQTGELLGRSGGGVAYMAHITGYIFGFFLSVVLLATRIVKREEFDVFYLFQQARRRAAFRAANKQAAAIWESSSADTGKRLSRATEAAAPMAADEIRRAQERSEINRLASANDPKNAALRYAKLLREDPKTVFTEQRQLELANQLYALEDYATAAAAYELLLERFAGGPKATEVHLILAVLYARQLNRPDRARELIEAARPNLHETAQKALADQLLSELSR